MVKIKDNIDKIELETFLLENGFYQRGKKWQKSGHFKVCKNGSILPLNGGGNDRFDIICKMVERGFIEIK